MATLLRDTALPTDTDATDTGGDALRCAARLCQQMRAACVTTAAASLWASYLTSSPRVPHSTRGDERYGLVCGTCGMFPLISILGSRSMSGVEPFRRVERSVGWKAPIGVS